MPRHACAQCSRRHPVAPNPAGASLQKPQKPKKDRALERSLLLKPLKNSHSARLCQKPWRPAPLHARNCSPNRLALCIFHPPTQATALLPRSRRSIANALGDQQEIPYQRYLRFFRTRNKKRQQSQIFLIAQQPDPLYQSQKRGAQALRRGSGSLA